MVENVFIWLLTFLVILAIFIPYYIKFRRTQKQQLERKREAKTYGIDRPRGQYPFIDQSRCIGCGSCVDACPEGDVLGVVFGKATVINGMRCVGHGLCEKACPVEAIEVGLGDIKKRSDIPILNEYYESTVPGLYIVGELGGLSLIRNAIHQGRVAVEHIASTRDGNTPSGKPDLIIVGAGPAGLTATLTAIQHGLDYILLDQQDPGGTILQYPRRKLVMTQPVEIPLYGRLKKEEIEKEELLDIWYQIIEKYQIRIHSQEKVEKVIPENGGFRIVTGQNQYFSPRVVLALGRRGTPRKLGVPGEQSKKVAYQLIDAQSYQHKKILVVGGGDSAIEAAVGLARQPGNQVTISYRKPQFFRIKKKNEERLGELIRKKKITPIFNSQVQEIREDSVLLRVDDKRLEIANDYVFVFIGGEPPFPLLKEAGVRFGGEISAE